MDVLLLSRLLKELIIDNDCIPLPGMGYFQTEPMPAYFSEDGKTIYPPSKRISFRKDERATGDLVGKYYAAGTGMDGKTAATELEAFLRQLKITLQEKTSIEFPGLGRLRCTLEGDIYFTAEQDGGIFAKAFGFEPVTLKPIRTNGVQPSAEEPKVQQGPDARQTELQPSLPQPASAPEKPVTAAGTTAEPSVTVPQDKDTPETEKSGIRRIILIILAVLAALIIAAVILVMLGRSGRLDHIIYSEEELELIEQQGL